MISEKIHVRKKEKRKSYAILGLAAIIFGIIGALVVLINVFNFAMGIFNDEGTKAEMKRLIAPMVILDPAPMVKMDRATEDTITLASLMYCMMMEDETKYMDANQGYYIVPQTDVESYCAKMFGENYLPVHKTVSDYENTYRYSEEEKCYYVPLVTRSGNYHARVISYSQKNEFYYVRVGYIAPEPVWSQDYNDMNTKAPEKYMQYVLKKINGQFTIFAINEDPESNTSSQQSSSGSSSSQSTPSSKGNV